MRLKLDAKNPRIVRDQDGEEIFTFTGLHLDDLREILSKVNDYQDWIDSKIKYSGNPSYSKKSTEI